MSSLEAFQGEMDRTPSLKVTVYGLVDEELMKKLMRKTKLFQSFKFWKSYLSKNQPSSKTSFKSNSNPGRIVDVNF